MKRIFILLFICSLWIPGIYSQSSYVLKTDIWYDSEQQQPMTQQQSSQSSKNNLQATANVSPNENALLNFHSVKAFNEQVTPLKSSYDISKSSRLTVIVVFHSPDTSSEHGIWSVIRDGKQITGLTDRQLLRQKSQYQYPVKKRGIPLINTSMQAFSKIRGKADSNHFVMGEAILPDSTLSTFSGDIAECLVFSRFLKKTEALKIETYLAIKYGISLIESNYLSPTDVVLWNYEENKEYSNGIAGIGKDSTFSLNQKQGCSSEEVDLLTISTGNFSMLNKNNNFTLPEANYLLWGHNEKELIYNELACDEAYPLLERKWLMQTTYTDANSKFSTMVKLQLPEQYRDTSRLCYLVIDRSGTGDFTLENVEYIVQNLMDLDGFVYFSNVVWDNDGSGKDAFTFSFGAVMELVATPSCPTSPTGTISSTLCGGMPPFDYLLTNDTTNQQYTYQAGRDYTFENLPAGTYTLDATDFSNIVVSKQITIDAFPTLEAYFPSRYTIKQNDNQFDAQEYFESSAMSYLWEKDSIFFSDEASVDLSVAGRYKLTATDSNGCSYVFNTLVEENLLSHKQKNISSGKGQEELLSQENAEPQYKVYPNPTTGKYTIEAQLPEESPVTVRVYSANGSLINTWEDDGKKYYSFDSYLSSTGNYIVEIETTFGTKNLKLVVTR